MDNDALSPEALMWGQPGNAYDGISFGLSDTISHTVQALWPRPRERVLDIGSGTGWASRLAAWRGASVTGVDIAPGMIAAAEKLSKGLDPRLSFRLGSAEALPFEGESFDGVISTYGVIFSNDPPKAISEMARVLRPRGRVALATWADIPDGYIAQFFALIGEWSGAPPPPASPFDWGRADWLGAAMGQFFNIEVHEQVTTLYAPDVETVWQEYVNGFGPVATTYAALDEDSRDAFRAAFQDFHRPFETGQGLTIPRRALVVRGHRN